MHQRIFSILCIVLTTLSVAEGDDATDTRWPLITAQTKPWARWWWPGSAVDEKNLAEELQQFSAVGLGGVEVTPIYGANGAEDRVIDFLSPQWIKLLSSASDRARSLGINLDMATCTGWPFGGPNVKPEDGDASLAIIDEKLTTKPTRMKVKRAAPGGAGLVLNPYSTEALESYLGGFSSLPAGICRAQFHDSFEYMGNWTATLPDLFKTQMGYDLADHVAELSGKGDADAISRVKSDYRTVLSNLHLAYVQRWVDWSHARNEQAREQAHGAPCNLLDLYGAADIPETETFGSTPFDILGYRRDPADVHDDQPSSLATKFASSAAHVMGHPLASSETLTWLREHFKISLAMAKPQIDQMFLAGINHIIYHGTCYSPADAAWPGWLFYASTDLNPRMSIWHDLPRLNAYVARCQSVLQANKPDNDLLVYYPVHDLWSRADGLQIFCRINPKGWLTGTAFEKSAENLSAAGCAFDLVSDTQLAGATGAGGKLKTKGGVYSALLLPPVDRMPPETLEKVAALSEAGVTILVQDHLPLDVPGFSKLTERRARFAEAARRLQLRHADEKTGRVVVAGMAELLEQAPIRQERFVGEGIGYIRRARPDGTDYFIAAQGAKGLNGWIHLATPLATAELMDPLTGQTGAAALHNAEQGKEIYLQIPPGGSLIVRTFTQPTELPPSWPYWRAGGAGTDLGGAWSINFISDVDPTAKLPPAIQTSKLVSWTELGGDEAEHFSGTARYRLTFDRSAGIEESALLDLGDVREAAAVRLNGNALDGGWCLPFQIRVTNLKPTGNVLEVDVTNLTANRIRNLDQRGVKWRIMKEINFVNIAYKPFDAAGWGVAPSGLLGPVRLMPGSFGSPPPVVSSATAH